MVVGVGLAERAQTGPACLPTLAQLLVTDRTLPERRLDLRHRPGILLEAYGNPDDSWDHLVFFGQRLPLPRSPRRVPGARR
ncbi:MAG: hypothetical protein R3E96_00695 [Planctomycetota bacterium]